MSKLFEPTKIGMVELKNRILRSATAEKAADDKGRINENMFRIHEELAKGGAGLIIVGYAYVNPWGRSAPFQTGIYSDELIPELEKLTKLIHGFDTPVILQLCHGGRQTHPRFIEKAVPVAPSAVEEKTVQVMPREITEEEIYETIEDFKNGAKRAIEAGFDGVELHSAHGYLINQFISPYTNKRTDSWGGNMENRMRFLIDTYKKIRKEIGERIIMVKLNAEDFLPDGLTLEESTRISIALEKEGVDAIEISGGMWESSASIIRKDIDSVYKEGYFVGHAKTIKKSVKVPIAVVGGIKSRVIIDNILEKHNIDLISMSRSLIREPDLPNKLRNGKETADCISCNGCLSSKTVPTHCIQLK